MTPSFKNAIRPPFQLTVATEDGSEKTYRLLFPIYRIIELENALGGCSLKDGRDWIRNLKFGDLPAVLHAGLQEFHPEVTIEEVQGWVRFFSLEDFDNLHFALVKFNCPGFGVLLERIRNGEVKADDPNV